jgi:hypothetical protein
MERVLRRREGFGLGERPYRQLGHLRFADHDAAGRSQPSHQLVIPLCRLVRGRRGARPGRKAGDVEVVLDRDRNARQRKARIGRRRLGERLLPAYRLERVELRLEFVDTREAVAHISHGAIFARST